MAGAWIQVFAQLGVAGILGWYLWYTTTVSFPRISEQHLARVDDICKNHDKALDSVMDKFSDELKHERQFHREDLVVLAKAFVCQAQKARVEG